MWRTSWQRLEAFSDGMFLSEDGLFLFAVSTWPGSRPDDPLSSGSLPCTERGGEATGHANADTA